MKNRDILGCDRNRLILLDRSKQGITEQKPLHCHYG